MDQVIALIGIILGSSGLSAVVVAVLNRRWAQKDREEWEGKQYDERVDAMMSAQKVLMVDKIRYLGKKYVSNGEIHLEDKENIVEMYAAYKALGGNGHLDMIMHEVNRLSIADTCHQD